MTSTYIPAVRRKPIHPAVAFLRDQCFAKGGIRELVMNSGIPGDTINGWFGGRTSPKLRDIEKMANALGYTLMPLSL